jgi:hypothetical protein
MRLGIQGLLKDPTNDSNLHLEHPGSSIEEEVFSEEFLTAFQAGINSVKGSDHE